MPCYHARAPKACLSRLVTCCHNQLKPANHRLNEQVGALIDNLKARAFNLPPLKIVVILNNIKKSIVLRSLLLKLTQPSIVDSFNHFVMPLSKSPYNYLLNSSASTLFYHMLLPGWPCCCHCHYHCCCYNSTFTKKVAQFSK